jgi:hypothetical protein
MIRSILTYVIPHRTTIKKLITVTMLLVPIIVAAQTKEAPFKVKDIKRIEQIDVMEETRIEKELLEGDMYVSRLTDWRLLISSTERK